MKRRLVRCTKVTGSSLGSNFVKIEDVKILYLKTPDTHNQLKSRNSHFMQLELSDTMLVSKLSQLRINF